MVYYRKDYKSPDGLFEEHISGYRNRKVNGKFPDTPYKRSIYRYPRKGAPLPPVWGGADGSPYYAIAYEKAYKLLIRKVQDRADMMANCFELSKTIGTVSSALNTTLKATAAITRGIRALKHGNPGAAVRRFKEAKAAFGAQSLKKFNDTAAGAVLAVNWGLRPVIDDVSKMLNDRLRENLLNGKDVTSKAGSGDSWTTSFGDKYNFEYKQANVVVRLKCRVRIDNMTLYQVARTGLTNPLATAWELTPFSFVVDWFVNVGEILGALSDLQGLVIDNTCISSTQRTSTHVVSYEGDLGTSTAVEFKRVVGVLKPPPAKLVFSSPLSGTQRLLNQVAFLVTQSKSLRT